MFTSILNAFSGMLGFSKGLDVVSNNLANLNTPGFKASELEFRDLFYRLGLEQGNDQLGQGVRTGNTRTLFRQGDLRDSGNSLDTAIDGNGFFIVRKDGETFYTRTGQFQFNSDGFLIETVSGARVAAFDNGQLVDISLAGLRVNAPKPTTEIKLTNTLSSSGTTHTINNVTAIDASGATRTLTLVFTKSNQANLNTGALTTVDTPKLFTLKSSQLSTIRQTTTTTTETVEPFYTVKAGDTAKSIALLLYGSDAQSTVDAMLAAIGKPTIATGATLTGFPETLSVGASAQGYVVKSGDTFDSIARLLYGGAFGPELQAALGNPTLTAGQPLTNLPATLSVSTTGGSVNRWTIEVKEGDGSLGKGEVRFDGSGALIAGFNTAQFDLKGNGVGATTIKLNFGDAGTTGASNGFSSGDTSTLKVDKQDGLGPGALVSSTFDENGKLTLSYSNGQTTTHEQLAVAIFENTQALTLKGGNLFVAPSDLKPVIAAANDKGTGKIAPKKIELSNVQLTEQFTDIVILQRGFQASSQVISVTNEMMQQLLDLRARR